MIDASVSLDGFVAGPGDGPDLPLGGRGGERVFDWYFGGRRYGKTMFKPKGAVNRRVVEEMFLRSGAMLTGRRTYEIARGWGGEHPVNAIPVVIMTHDPPAEFPHGRSRLVFATDGVESALACAKALAKGKDVGIGGASVAQQALRAGLVDEVHLHVAPILLGDGVRLFDRLGAKAIMLRPVEVLEGEGVTHLRFSVLKGHK